MIKDQEAVIKSKEDALRECLVKCAQVDTKKEHAEEVLDGRMKVIQDSIMLFEACTSSIQSADLEEVFRMRRPTLGTRIAVVIYGILYGILDPNGDNIEVETFEQTKVWWPTVLQALGGSKTSINRFRGFSLQRIQGNHGRSLLNRVLELIDRLKLVTDLQDIGDDSANDASNNSKKSKNENSNK